MCRFSISWYFQNNTNTNGYIKETYWETVIIAHITLYAISSYPYHTQMHLNASFRARITVQIVLT